MSNLKQLSLAWKMYSSDNLDKLAQNGDENDQPASVTDTKSKILAVVSGTGGHPNDRGRRAAQPGQCGAGE